MSLDVRLVLERYQRVKLIVLVWVKLVLLSMCKLKFYPPEHPTSQPLELIWRCE
jgi:hypothetical protein